MSAAAAIAALADDGITLEVDSSGRLLARPAGRLSADHRNLIRAYRPALVALLAPDQDREQDPPRRLWYIRHADGSRASHSFTPPATRAEVCAWYPGAVVEDDPPSGRCPEMRSTEYG